MDELRHVDRFPGDKQPRSARLISHFSWIPSFGVHTLWEFVAATLSPLISSEIFRVYYVTKYIDHHAHTLVFYGADHLITATFVQSLQHTQISMKFLVTW